LAYEVMDGNTSDRTTLRGFLDKIEKIYGKAKRMWVMDRGVPTEEILQEMRDPARQIFYLVGTPKGKIQQYERKWLDLPWQTVRDSVEVKLFEQDGELYVLAKSEGRRAKETAMRRKRLARCESWANSNTVHLRNYRVFCLAGGQNIAMARTLASLPTGSRVTDYISLGVVSRAI